MNKSHNQPFSCFVVVMRSCDMTFPAIRQLHEEVERQAPHTVKNILIDCADLYDADCEGTDTFLSMLLSLRPLPARLVLFNVCPKVESLLLSLGADYFLHIVPTLDDAILLCRQAGNPENY